MHKEIPKCYDFNTGFKTYIIAFCPDTDSWFVTSQRFFFYEYGKGFRTEQEGVDFFKKNPKIFYDKELEMGFRAANDKRNYIYLENTATRLLLKGD